jgi:glycosyltransferase involved in cell wall biosynthesis
VNKPLPLLLWHLGRRGGGPRYTLELARELAQRQDVTLHLALSRQSEFFAETAPLGQSVLALDTYAGAAGFVAGLFRIPFLRRTLLDYVRRHGITASLCSMAHLWNPLLVPALKQAGVVHSLVVHDAIPHPGDHAWLRRSLIGLDIKQADGLFTLSESVRRQIIGSYAVSPSQVVSSTMAPFRYGGASDRLPRQLGAAPHRLLFFGRWLPYKGLEQLIDAMGILERQGIAVTLRIVGDGPVTLTDLPATVTLDRRWVAESEIAGLFAKADLLVLPYQEASQSGVLPIARHLGVPAVVTPVGGLSEQVAHGKTGMIAADTSASAVAASIRGAVTDPEGYASMSSSMLSDDSDLWWRQTADGMLAALHRFARIA